jgi:sulfonate transport system substrate-binding protein
MSVNSQYPSRRALLAGMGAGAFGLLAAACASPASGASEKPSSGLPGSVGVGTIAPYVEVAVMQQEGFLGKTLGSGVSTKFVPLLSQVPMQDAIAGGSLNIGQSATPTSAIGEGQPIKIVAIFEHNVNGEGVLVRPDGPIKTLADLKGKKIGGPTAVPTVQLYEALKSVGLTLNDVTLEALEANVGVAGLVRGAVDAYYTFDPYYTQAIVDGQAVSLDLGPANIEAWIPVIVNSSFLAQYPKAVYDYLVAMKQSIAWIDQNPAQTQQLYASDNKLSTPLTKEILGNRVRELMVPNANFYAQCEQDGDFQYQYGLIKNKINWDNVIDTSLVQKAIAA